MAGHLLVTQVAQAGTGINDKSNISLAQENNQSSLTSLLEVTRHVI